ncbi:C1 family peptidase [Bradyrhizobium sp.]|uniref:C1 family peptidase n=1 Tax=Bradyrhizobium sp. TaxID=376 RepID=UPI003BB140C9
MSRSLIGNSKQAASRRDILKKGMALGAMTAAATLGSNTGREAAASERYRKRHNERHKRRFTLPKWVDLRNVGSPGKNYITAIQNQDAYGACNSCTAFAVVATVEGSYNWQKNQPIPTSGTTPALSEAELFFCANLSGGCNCRAWYPEQALAFCFNPGLTDRSNNDGSQMVCKSPTSTWNWTTITGIQRLKDANDMKKWISGASGPGGPVIAVMIEYQDLRTWNYGATPYTPSAGTWASPNRVVGGHVVSIVGYDDRGATPFWICKNSWGTAWNGDGYFNVLQENPGHPITYINSFDMLGVVVA